MTANNNPIMQILALTRAGANPTALLQQLAGQNPQAANILQQLQGKTPKQLQAIAQGMAQEKGINLEQFVQSLGLKL